MDATSNSSSWEPPFLTSFIIFISHAVTRLVLLVPISIFVLYQACWQWRRQRRSFTSHFDVFTFHNAGVEISWALGCLAYHCHYGYWSNVGLFLMSVGYLGQSCFHMLTCGERYLAAVHPVTYRGLKTSRGVRIRDVVIGCVWLLCSVFSYVIQLTDDTFDLVTLLTMSAISLVFNSFCSISVLCILVRPKPGDGGGDQKGIDQSKLRAFYTILAVLGAIWLWFIPFIVCSALLKQINMTSVPVSLAFWFNLPSSLVLPLLYLHRTGRLACCHRTD